MRCSTLSQKRWMMVCICQCIIESYTGPSSHCQVKSSWPSQSLKRWELSQVLIVYQFPFALLIFNWGNINLFLFCISRKYGNHLRGKYIQNITMFKNLMANPKFSHFREQGNFISINYTSIEFSQALVCSFIRNSGNLHHSMLHLSAYLLYASCSLFNALSVHTQIFTTMVATVSCK